MRGFKAKVLRRIALMTEKDNTQGYIYPRGRRHPKMFFNPLKGTYEAAYVSGQAVLASRADRLYNQMKRELSRGGQ